MALQKPCITGK